MCPPAGPPVPTPIENVPRTPPTKYKAANVLLVELDAVNGIQSYQNLLRNCQRVSIGGEEPEELVSMTPFEAESKSRTCL